MPVCDHKIEEQIHSNSTLKYVGFAFPVTAFVLSLSSNLLMLLGIYKSKAYSSRFLTIVLSIAMADLLMATVVSPISIYLTSEYSNSRIHNVQHIQSNVYMVLLFTLAIAAVCSLAFLSIDRYIFLKNPETYALTLSKKRHFSIIALLWGLSLAISNTQHLMKFRVFIFLLSIFVLATSGVVMTVTLYAYWRHFSRTQSNRAAVTTIPSYNNNEPPPCTQYSHRTSRATIYSLTDDVCSLSTSTPSATTGACEVTTKIPQQPLKTIVQKVYSLDMIASENSRKPSDTPSVATLPGATEDFFEHYTTSLAIKPNIVALETEEKQKKRWILGKDIYESRIVLTLAIMTGIYWLSYCPVIFAGFYLYFCSDCSCLLLNTLFNVIAYAIMISSGLRPIVFVLRFSQPREAVCNLFNRRHRRQRHYTHRNKENNNNA